jgi:hypothetical protein
MVARDVPGAHAMTCPRCGNETKTRIWVHHPWSHSDGVPVYEGQWCSYCQAYCPDVPKEESDHDLQR